MTSTETWVKIAVALIGSSLFGFLLTNLAIDYNQSKIRINVENTFQNTTQKRYDTTIANDGNSAATNLRITLHYIAGKIINYRVGFTAENSTSIIDPERQGTLVINASRFAPSSVMLISTIVNNSQAPFYVDLDSVEYNGRYIQYNGSYFVSAVYDQGGTQVSSSDISQRAYQPIEKIIPLSIAIGVSVIITIILAASIIIYIHFYKKTRSHGDFLYRSGIRMDLKHRIRIDVLMILATVNIVSIVLLLYFSGIWAMLWS